MPQKFNRPAAATPATSDDFAEALTRGNAFEVADVLSRMRSLGPSDCNLLAEHFVGEPSPFFPLRLQFVRRRSGRPASDQLQKLHDNAKIKQLFSAAYAKGGKFESAVKDVMDKTGFSRTHVTGVLAQKSK
jgi:hypothetical protein